MEIFSMEGEDSGELLAEEDRIEYQERQEDIRDTAPEWVESLASLGARLEAEKTGENSEQSHEFHPRCSLEPPTFQTAVVIRNPERLSVRY